MMRHANAAITGRYEIRHHGRKGTPLAPVYTDCEVHAIRQAEIAGVKVIDTVTGWVWSHQTQTWLRPDTQSVIDGEFSKVQESVDWNVIAKAIARDVEAGIAL